MVDKDQRSQKQNRREFLTSSVAGAGAGVLVLGTSQTAKGEVVSQSGRGRIARNWKLQYHENFGKPLPVDSAPWERDPLNEDSPWHVDDPWGQNDHGEYFKIFGGEEFERHLDSFDVLRKRVPFGKDNWLTAELAARDYDKDGDPESFADPDWTPSLRNVTLPAQGGRAAKLEVPHDTGVFIRPTDALPSQYRVEYTLRSISFGGERNGSVYYDGKYNGYQTDGCKTSWPWDWGNQDYSGPASMCNPNFRDVRSQNGYYFLSIVDYPNPAPHNNLMIHHQRKVNMDGFNVTHGGGEKYYVCNPAAKELYNYDAESTRNAINAFYPGDGDRVHVSECGQWGKNEDPKSSPLVSTAEIKPELMPDESYQFAIERDEDGYAVEMSGNFRFIGEATLRYHRDFIQNGRPIWHYNNTPDEYDGQFGGSETISGPHGTINIEDTWPSDSAYPDYFIIGEPHFNWYEGEAVVDDIKLYHRK
jgi:hypothetical protein